MLKIFDTDVPIVVDKDSWYITHKYDGYDILSFEISAANEVYKELSEELRITDGNNIYIIKNIDEHSGYVNIDCEIDLSDWKLRFWREFRTTDSTLQQVLGQVLPEGWDVQGAQKVTKHDTIELSEGKGLENVTSEDILNKASEIYGFVPNFDVAGKVLHIVIPESFPASGEYLTDELNLMSVGFVGNTKDFATRLYAYGKKDENGNPVTFADINGGKDYVEDYSYSNRLICVGWSDERYTVKESLLQASKEKLKTVAYPIRSYECSVVNLDNNLYMYKVLTLIDRRRRTRVDHRVIEFKKYPEASYLDSVNLSAVPPRIEGTIKSIKTEVKEKISASQQVSTQSVLDAMNVITGAKGGHITIEIINGLPEAIKVRHSDNTETVINENGMNRASEPYFYLTESGTLSMALRNGKWIGNLQLPDKFAEKEIVVHLRVKSIKPVGLSDVLQEISSSWEYSKSSRALVFMCECSMLNVASSTKADPQNIEIEYSVLGR